MNGTIIGMAIAIDGEVISGGVFPPLPGTLITEDALSYLLSENDIDLLIEE